jgi:hypothetical protein
MSKKKAVDTSGLHPKARDTITNSASAQKLGLGRGIGGKKIAEPVPGFVASETEKVLASSTNANIVLGRDRPGSRLSGYGGSGDTHCGSIDLVAGRMANFAATATADGEPMSADPNFKLDAARIYMSQKTDVDANFGLADGNVGNASAKSAIGLKADGVRIIAREGIKLVTKTDMKNSQGGAVEQISGIDLIAGNDDEQLQPIPLGNNLEEALVRITDHVDKLIGIMDNFLMYQMKYNTALATHFHHSPFFGAPTSPSPPAMAGGVQNVIDCLADTKRSLMTQRANLIMFKETYFSIAGGKYINSRYNNTT